MTIQEFDKQIAHLKKVNEKARGMQSSDLTEIIDDLETKRVELLTAGLINLQINLSANDVAELNDIAATFDQERENITNVTGLIDKAIGIGKQLVSFIP